MSTRSERVSHRVSACVRSYVWVIFILLGQLGRVSTNTLMSLHTFGAGATKKVRKRARGRKINETNHTLTRVTRSELNPTAQIVAASDLRTSFVQLFQQPSTFSFPLCDLYARQSHLVYFLKLTWEIIMIINIIEWCYSPEPEENWIIESEAC